MLQTSNCSLLLIYLTWKDERLSRPSWLTCSGRFTHVSGHLSAVGGVQDRETSPVKDQHSTAVSCSQPGLAIKWMITAWEVPGSNTTVGSCIFIMTAMYIVLTLDLCWLSFSAKCQLRGWIMLLAMVVVESISLLANSWSKLIGLVRWLSAIWCWQWLCQDDK